MYTTLKDNGVVVDWSTVENVRAFLFSESKRIITGECLVSADPDDDQVLVVDYLASSSQELGVNRLVIRVTYHDRVKTYDKLALNFVSITALATGMTILEDPTFAVEVDAPEEFVPTVGIDVAEVSTSVLDAAIDAAIAAAKEAEEAAREARDAAEAAMDAIADCPTREEYDAHLAGKVDKEDGKGLSSNDFTDEDKAAVEGIPSALEAKQDKLIPGENIKTINGQDILGEGDIEIQGKGGFEPTDEQRDAMDSGINADKVSQYDAYATEKQDVVADLDNIREGAGKGATALQSVPSTYRTASEQDVIDAGKQDVIADLETIRRNSANAVYVSTEDFCDSVGDASVINVENEATILPSRTGMTEGWLYDYCEGWRVVPDFGTWLNAQGGWENITWGDLLAHFDEISTPIGEGGSGFEPTTDQLNAMNSGITSTKVAKYDGYASGKQDKISDLVTIRSNAAKAATSVQTSGDQRIEGQKIFSDLRVVEDTYDETILFEAGYEAESDLLRLNLNDTYDGESVVLGHVADPVLDHDAVNKQTLEAEISKVQPGKTYAFAISPDMYELVLNPTKGVSPYNPSYGYVDITIKEETGVKWVEGGMYTIMVANSNYDGKHPAVTNTYRNGRVRIGENGTWYPLVTVATNQVITASNILNVNQTTVMVFKKNAYPDGALHCLYVTTYSIATQAEIDAGTSTAARLISPKLMMDNYGSKIAALETKMNEVYDDYLTADSLL